MMGEVWLDRLPPPALLPPLAGELKLKGLSRLRARWAGDSLQSGFELLLLLGGVVRLDPLLLRELAGDSILMSESWS